MVKPNCTQSSTSSTEPVSDTTSSSAKYKGVRKRKWGKWVSEIRLPNSRERIWLGSYDSAEKAARAFDAALYCLRGRDAKFNFPENPPEIAGGRSLSPLEIQAVAARFANEVEAAGTTPPVSDNHTNNNNNAGTEQYTLSSSVTVSEGGGATIQMESHHAMMDDWSFFSELDTNQGMPDYNFYPGLGHLPGDDHLYPPPILPPSPPPIDHNMDDDPNGGDIFSQPSFLWNF